MEKIRFRAKQLPTGIKGAVMLEAQEMVDELTEFLRAEHAYARAKKQKDPEYELEFDCQLKRWYRRRSLNANNLAWELCTRLGQVDGVSKETVYYAIKELTDLPRDEYKGVFVQRASSDLTTVEFAKFIERLVIECQTHDPTIEIHDIWILFTEWRFGQDKDPLEGSYFGKEDYREKHPCCEGCGKYLLYTGNEGELRHAGEVAHIVAVGSGGADEDWNWLLLCNQGHVQLQHQKGWNAFLKGHD